jgi:hypothetical protein
MMDRCQRIEYEILDCALNKARHSEGYATTLPAFVARLQQLFPDLQTAEFVSITKWLFRQKLLGLRKSAGVFFRDYRGEHDDHEFFYAGDFYLRPTILGEGYYRDLVRKIMIRRL